MTPAYASAIGKLTQRARSDKALGAELRANWASTISRVQWLSAEEKRALIQFGSVNLRGPFRTDGLSIPGHLDAGTALKSSVATLYPPVDVNVRWRQADRFAMLMDNSSPDPAQWAWNSGRTRDVVVTQNGNVVVASETGGVWLAEFTGRARPLSNDWQYPNTYALAQGRVYPGNPASRDHVLAGGADALDGRGGALYETDVTSSTPLDRWLPVKLTDASGDPIGLIYRIVAIDDLVFIACGTGVYWSFAPTPGSVDYSWQPALRSDTFSPLNDNYFGLAVARTNLSASTPQYTVIASAPSLSDGHSPVIVYGTWSGWPLLLAPATISDETGLQLDAFGTGRLSSQPPVGPAYIDIFSSTANGAVVAYAAIRRHDGGLRGIWRSLDRGKTWGLLKPYAQNVQYPLWSQNPNDQQVASTFPDNPYDSPGCIAVSPIDPNVLACGWAGDGPFISDDGGQTWRVCGGGQLRPDDPNYRNFHVHADFRNVRFGPAGSPYPGLFICTDGGLAYAYAPDEPCPESNKNSNKLGACWTSQLNRELLTLQCLGSSDKGYGTFSASPDVNGLVASSLIDNGTVYAQLGTPDQYWVNFGATSLSVDPFEGPSSSDGTIAFLLPAAGGAPTTLIHANRNQNGGLRPDAIWWSTWDGAQFKYRNNVLWSHLNIDSSRGAELYAQQVCSLRTRDVGGLLFAVGFAQYADAAPPSLLMGLFYDRDHAPTWFPIVELPEPARCCGSFDGSRVLVVGLNSGRIYSYDTSKAKFNTIALPAAGAGVVDAVDFDSRGRAYLLRNDFVSNRGSLLAESGHTFVDASGDLIGARLTALAVNRNDDSVFVSTDTDVFCWRTVTSTSGVPRIGGPRREWFLVRTGLPVAPHATNLAVANSPDRRVRLYMSTYGRSIWSADLGYW